MSELRAAQRQATEKRARKAEAWQRWLEVQPESHKSHPRDPERERISFLGSSWGDLRERLIARLKKAGKPVPQMPINRSPIPFKAETEVKMYKPTPKPEPIEEEETRPFAGEIEVRLGRRAYEAASAIDGSFAAGFTIVDSNTRTITHSATPKQWSEALTSIKVMVEYQPLSQPLSSPDRKALKRAIKTITKALEAA